MTLNPNQYNIQLKNLFDMLGAPDLESKQRNIAREQVSQVQSKLNLSETEAKGLVADASAGYLQNKGLSGDAYTQAIQKQLNIINASQADVNSWRLWLSKNVPTIAPSVTVGGAIVSAWRALSFARVIMAGGTLAMGFAAMGPLGIIAAAVAALGYILPSALNVSNDYTAMQPTMMAGLLLNLKQEYEKGQSIGITSFGSYSETDITNLYNAYVQAGIGAYSDPIAQQSRLMTLDNLRDSLRGIVTQLNAQGTAPTKGDVLAVLAGWIFNEISNSTKREIPGFEKVGGPSLAGAGLTRLSTQKTAKPKTYIGTLLGGKVADAAPFVRQLDDEITDENDLLKDAQINMVNWLKALPGKITYEIQVKFNPFDENQIRKVGYWVTLALYVNNAQFKRLFIDEILLGPIDPIKYYPEQTINKTLQYELPKELTPTEIKALQSDMGELITIDETGNMVRTFSNEQKAQGASERQTIATLENVVANLKKQIEAKIEEVKPVPAPIPPAPVSTPTSLPTPPQPAPVVAPTFTPTTSAPVSVPPPPPPPPPAPPAPPADPWEVGKTVFVNTPGTILNIRDGASLSARDMGNLPHRMAVVILSQPTYKDGYSWIIVRTPAGQTGYVAREYLTTN